MTEFEQNSGMRPENGATPATGNPSPDNNLSNEDRFRKDAADYTAVAKRFEKINWRLRLVRLAVIAMAVFLILLFTTAVLYVRHAALTVQISGSDRKYLLLSEHGDFSNPRAEINCGTPATITNIDGRYLPLNLDDIDGQHNGEGQYLAYTFYCGNVSENQNLTYQYKLVINGDTKDLRSAIRFRLYVDGESNDYAEVKSSGSGEPEEGTIKFYDNNTVTVGQISEFYPGDLTKYTVVIWLEGPDADCNDDKINGMLNADMYFQVISAESID